MSRHSRRSLFAGLAGVAGAAAIGRIPGVRTARAQGAAYDIVRFGPITEGVMGEGRFRPDFGGIYGIHADGTAFGNTPASADKFFPSLFTADGAVTKLKSGEFGGVVNGLNAEGVAVGAVYENIGGLPSDESQGQLPAVWIDGELTRLELPADKRYDYSRAGGYASSVSDDGAILGTANGYSVLWIDGAPNALPDQTGNGDSISYSRITPGGTLIGYRSYYDENDDYRTEYGAIDGTTLTPFAVSGFGNASPTLYDANSADEVLLSGTPTDLPLANIVAVGAEPDVIDLREAGMYFFVAGFNTDHDVVGAWRSRQDLQNEPAIYQGGTITPLAELLPADLGLENLRVRGISDDGIIAGTGWDADGGFHPLLFVPV